MALGDGLARLAVGCEQRLVGENIDAARKPAGGACEQARGAGREYVRTAIARRAHAKGEVGRHLGRGQRPHAEAVRNAIAQLAKRRLGERGVELGLSEKHDLQELVAA